MYFWSEYIVIFFFVIGMIPLFMAILTFPADKGIAFGWGFFAFVLFTLTVVLHYGDGHMLPNSEDDHKLAAFVKLQSANLEKLDIKRHAMWSTISYEGSPIVKRGIYRNTIRAYNELKYIEEQKIAQQKADLITDRLDNLLGHSPLEEEQ